MSNLEHYFENLLFSGEDVKGDWNKNSLTEEEQNAVEMCAQYVLYSLFCGRDELKKVLESHEVDAEPVRHGHWIDTNEGTYCSECRNYPYDDGEFHILYWRSDYCPNCGAKMIEDKE